MKILAGVDKDFDGTCELVEGIKIGYLQQEPPLDDGDTVESNIEMVNLAQTRGSCASVDFFARNVQHGP